MDIHERCFLCGFWSGSRCTQTWRLIFLIEPQEGGIGGQIDFATVPGMVPEELKPKINEYFQKFIDKLVPAITMMPVWNEVREYQLAHSPETDDCPARKVRKDLAPFLHLVRT